jgi:hypothetical protein
MTDNHLTIDALHERLRDFIRTKLPATNAAVQRGDLSVVGFRDAWTDLPAFVDSILTGGSRLPPLTRWQMIGTLGFVVGSLERHSQEMENGSPGDGLASVDRLEIALRTLAGDDLPTRDTAVTFWLLNRGADLSYTGTDAERFFNEQVNAINDAETNANATMRLIVEDPVILTKDQAADLAALLYQEALNLKSAYNAFFRKSEAGEYPMPGRFFTIDFRTYLAETRIGATPTKGPNAAWLPAVFSFDALFGTSRNWYERHARETFRYQAATDRDQIVSDFVSGSLLDALIHPAVLDLPGGISSVDAETLAAKFDTLSAGRKILQHLSGSHRAIEKSIHAHEQAIAKFLDAVMAELPEEVRAKMAVDPERGTGGGSRKLVYDIGKMRTTNADWLLIRKAATLLRIEEG